MAKLQKISLSDVPTRWETRFFGTGALARILNVEEWRVKNFAMGRAYGLEASATVGTTKRRIRVFSMSDAMKIAIAWELTQFGFTPEAIGEAVKSLDEAQLREWGEAAELEFELSNRSPHRLVRHRQGWEVTTIDKGPVKEVTSDGGFMFHLPRLVERVVAQIKKLEEEDVPSAPGQSHKGAEGPGKSPSIRKRK